MNTFKISSLRAGLAVVTDRASDVELGTVELIDVPVTVYDPIHDDVVTNTRPAWEARRPSEQLVACSYGFPLFDTRADAAAYLAGNSYLRTGRENGSRTPSRA